jgi:hypothetical protein
MALQEVFESFHSVAFSTDIFSLFLFQPVESCSTMGNFYDLPARTGNSPHTKSGIPPPPTLKKSGSDAPSHRLHDPMSLELHMADERVRAEGLSPAERAWRV